MEMKKLHLGTMSYGVDSMDEVAHQLATALGEKPAQGTLASLSTCSVPRSCRVRSVRVGGLTTGVAIASSRGRRDMSSRVKDIVLALGLCHNVGS